MTNPCVFIVGCPRSGTTLFKRIVNAHPQIAIAPGGQGVLRRFLEQDGLTLEGVVTPDLVGKRPMRGVLTRDEFSSLVDTLTPCGQALSYSTLISRMADHYGEAVSKPWVGYKVMSTGHVDPGRVRRVPILHNLWPQAKFLHIIRDGRDVGLSVINWSKAPRLAQRFTSWTKDPVTTAGLWWEWQVQSVRQYGVPLGPELYHEIRYEALVSGPQVECAALCRFLGVPYDDAMLRFHSGKETDDPSLNAKHAWRPITPGLRDWRKEMPEPDVERFEAAAGGLLDELGYPRAVPRPSLEAIDQAKGLRLGFQRQTLSEGW